MQMIAVPRAGANLKLLPRLSSRFPKLASSAVAFGGLGASKVSLEEASFSPCSGRVSQRTDGESWQFVSGRGVKMAASGVLNSAAKSQDEVPLLRSLISGVAEPYFNKNPTAVTALDLIHKQDAGPVCYDHFAFRTFGVDGCGIDSIAQIFLDLNYTIRDELRFPAKKLRAFWYSPPDHLLDGEGELENGPLPRIFISEILVDQLSKDSQKIIRKYTKSASHLAKHAVASSVLNTLTWPKPSFADYQQLASESEYAAWTLVNGYSLNHVTVSVHRLGQMRSIVSPDGGLQQSSSVADSLQYAFADGEVKTVPASYIEFAERLVLPVHANLKHGEVQERHRREGFEVGNADKIFESTSSDQTGVQRG